MHYNRLFNLAVPVRRSLGLIKKAKPGYVYDVQGAYGKFGTGKTKDFPAYIEAR